MLKNELISAGDNGDMGKKGAGSKGIGGVLLSTCMPKGWTFMSDEYELAEEDEKNGLRDFLYEARDTAANTIGDFFSELGIESEQFRYIYNIPIGLDKESDIPGEYRPGVYAVIVGKNSDDVGRFLNSDGSRQGMLNNLARTMIHEMIHSFQTVPLSLEMFGTISSLVPEWRGLEEGMAEALACIVTKMNLEEHEITEVAQDFEEFCAKHEAPATQMSARLIGKMKPEQLKWYLTCSKTGEIKNNQFKKMFGDSYDDFCQNMNLLIEYEQGNNLFKLIKDRTVYQTSQYIDAATSREE